MGGFLARFGIFVGGPPGGGGDRMDGNGAYRFEVFDNRPTGFGASSARPTCLLGRGERKERGALLFTRTYDYDRGILS